MTRVLLDDAALAKLHFLAEPLELCDEAGRVLARLIPAFDESEWDPSKPNLWEEELRRREQSDEWYTTEEVLAHLKILENQ